MAQFLIYALQDPITYEIRYIGQSSTGLTRPNRHLEPHAYLNRKAHVYSWIKHCISNNYLPTIHIIKEVESKEELNKIEIFYINHYRKIGFRLTNHTDGGEGRKGYKQTKEEKDKRAFKNKGKKRSREFCERLSRLNTGKKHADEAKRKLSLIKKGKPLNHGEKISLNQRGIPKKKHGKLVDQFGTVYLNVKDFAKQKNAAKHSVYSHLNGNLNSVHGFQLKGIKG